ncbi:unnamed protein product [Diamesa serratosioi]
MLLIYFVSTANGFCPSKCICDGDVNNLKTKCMDAGLDVVPIQLNPNVKFINLTDNRISTVHYTFTFYTQLETLDISSNILESLGMKNFAALEQLRKLYLQKNVLKDLSKDAFKGLRQLEILDLSNNQISEIDPQAFSDLTRLSILDLTNNSVISVDIGVFKNLINLQTLLFTNNQLLSVPYTENFEFMRKLKRLDLSGNLIKQISNYSFQSMNQLQSLHLNGNVINNIDVRAFDGLVQLQYLDMSDNNLTIVPTDQLSKLSNLTQLRLNGNFIEILPSVSFMNLFQLRELHLDRLVKLIKIDARAFIDNGNLQILSMDDNEQFSDLPAHLFHGNLKLVELSIKNNKLFQLDAVQLPLDQLKKLSLADNPFVCNCSLIWLWELIKSSSSSTEKQTIKKTDSNEINQDVSETNDSEMTTSNGSNLLNIDKKNIGCDIIIKNDDNNMKVIRKKLMDMSEADIKCPTHIVTIISVILTVIFIAIICISILIVIKCSRTAQLRRRSQKYMSSERQNIGELIIPQKIDKFELERYLAEQQLQHQQKQQQIQQQYQMNHHTIQPIHATNQNQYFQHQNSLIKPNDYRSLKQWENIDDEECTLEEDHYENFDDNFLNTLNHKMNLTSTLPLTTPTTTTTLFNTNLNNKKHLQNNIKPHIVYV